MLQQQRITAHRLAITQTQTSTKNADPNNAGYYNYTITRTWRATDVSGNYSECVQTIIVHDITKPSITCISPASRLTNPGYCTYSASGSEFDQKGKDDDCDSPVSMSYELTGATTRSGLTSLNGVAFNIGVTMVKATATDISGNFEKCNFTVTVADDQNSTKYIIYATTEASFGEDNLINGDVGVTDVKGKADFKKGDVLNPYKVVAMDIKVQTPSSVNTLVYAQATNGPAAIAMFQMYNGTGGTGNYTASTNGPVTGNYKNLTIKKGVTATVSGNDFGKISIEDGATVTFTAPVINLVELEVKKAKDPTTTNVIFTQPTTVRVKDKVTVEENSRVNVGGPKVTFYLGDAKKDEENFTVKGDNSMVTLNIMIPNGKLKVNGGARNGVMTGWFVVEKLQSDGRGTTWNRYDCNPAPIAISRVNTTEASEKAEVKVKVKEVPGFTVTVAPNPSLSDFYIKVNTSSSEKISLRITDARGTVITRLDKVEKNQAFQVGQNFSAGTYFAEVMQGKNRQVLKLIKLN